MHDRFLKDDEFRASQREHHRDEEVCIKMDGLADKDFSHYMTESEKLISMKRCLHSTVYTKNLENDN